MKRTIVFGDIHGCYEEWQALMDKLKVSQDDQLISVGDLIFKGPSSKKTLELAMKLPNLKCVAGNHEYVLLKVFKHGMPKNISGYHAESIEEMGNKLPEFLNFIKTWPFYLDLPECIVVHAGIRPGLPLINQNPVDLTHIRKLEPEGVPWYSAYHNPKLIVYGHWAKQGLNIRENTIGLDSGCVYGKELSALVLPERKIVSVKAKKIYCPIKSLSGK